MELSVRPRICEGMGVCMHGVASAQAGCKTKTIVRVWIGPQSVGSKVWKTGPPARACVSVCV